MKKDVWTTQDGQQISISNMTDNHLLNTIMYLERIARKAKSNALQSLYSYTPLGEMAEWYNDQLISMLETEENNDDPSVICPQYDILVEEAIERKLLPEYYWYGYERHVKKLIKVDEPRFVYKKVIK